VTRRRPRLAAALVATAVLLAGCASDAPASSITSSDIRPFTDIQASAITFEADRTDPSRAVFHVTTSIPVICAIVWGTDATYGRFNNSLSMNGTGITQHDVVLPDVEPATTYTYVLEGVGPDGALYRSEVGTFRIDPSTVATTASTPSLGTNVAPKGSVAAVSSEYSSSFAATNAIDDDPATEWATKGDGDSASITLDLGADTAITGVEFVTRSMADGTATASMYTVSIDGAAPLGPFTTGTLASPEQIPLTARGRQFRFDVVRTTGGNVGAVEIRVFA